MKSLTILLLAAAMTVPGLSAPATEVAVASDVATIQDDAQAHVSANSVRLTDTLEAIELFIDREGVLDVAAALQHHDVEHSDLADFTEGYIAGGGEAEGAGVLAPDLIDESWYRDTAVALLACAGSSGTQWFPYTAVKLDSCQATQLSAALATGAGAAGIAGLITALTGAGAAVAGVIGGALAIYSSLITLCGSHNRGIVIGIISFLPPAVTCVSQ